MKIVTSFWTKVLERIRSTGNGTHNPTCSQETIFLRDKIFNCQRRSAAVQPDLSLFGTLCFAILIAIRLYR